MSLSPFFQLFHVVGLGDVFHSKKMETFPHIDQKTTKCGGLYLLFFRSVNDLEHLHREQRMEHVMNGKQFSLDLVDNLLWLRF